MHGLASHRGNAARAQNSSTVLNRLKAWARSLKRELVALSLAARDPRTPWYARALSVGVLAYALSPVDLIPDWIPVLGYLDDLLLVPLGLALAIRWIPTEVMQDCREQADADTLLAPNRFVGALIIGLWAVGLALVVGYFLRRRHAP